MLRCRTHKGSSCDYPHETFAVGERCSLCDEHLGDPCTTCQTGDTNESECALVRNAGCEHKFHHHCYIQHPENFIRQDCCPKGCPEGRPLSYNLTVDITQREMLPLSPRGRRLIVIHGNSTIATFSLDHSFGGNQDRAIVEYSMLCETLQELLGTSCESKKWFVVNGMKKGLILHHLH